MVGRFGPPLKALGVGSFMPEHDGYGALFWAFQ
jgi:hypothetical protein